MIRIFATNLCLTLALSVAVGVASGQGVGNPGAGTPSAGDNKKPAIVSSYLGGLGEVIPPGSLASVSALRPAKLPVSSDSAQNTLFLDRVIAQEDVVLTSGVWYGEGAEPPNGAGTFYLDIYRPSNHPLPNELPTIIYLHGGNGNKEAEPAPSYCYEFARRGYVAIAVQYRVGNVNTAAGDVANAIRWVRENAARYKVDTDKILVGGHSFGGVISAELTVNLSDYFGADEGRIAAALLCAAALNQFPVNTSAISLEGPPIMIVHGLNDPIATVDGIRSLVTDLDNLTDPVNGTRYPYRYLEVPGAGHAFYPGTGSGITVPFIAGPIDADQGWSNTEIAGKAVADHVFQFFFEHLKLGGTVQPEGIVHAASFDRGMTIAPGQIVSIFGANLGPVGGVSLRLEGNRVSNELGGTQVLLNGEPIPLLYVGASQVNVIVPYTLPSNRVRFEVRTAAGTSDPVELFVTSNNPGIFSRNGSGQGQGAILNQDFSINSADNPARRGEVVMVFGTGGGLADRPIDAAELAGADLWRLRDGASAVLGGMQAVVEYAGAAHGLVNGVNQFNVRIPATAPVGPAVPLVVFAGNSPSQQGLTVAIQD